MTTLQIREAVPNDSDDIQQITERGWNIAYEDILSKNTIETVMADEFDHNAVPKAIETSEGTYLVAEQQGEIRGYLHGVPSTKEGVVTLAAIYVSPEYWGEGIGTALLETFEQSSRQRGITKVQLRILSENDVGVSFYRKHGYTEIDQRETKVFDETVSERILTNTVE